MRSGGWCLARKAGSLAANSLLPGMLEQLPDRLAGGEDGDRAAGEVLEDGLRVDAQVAIEGGVEVLRGQGTLGGLAGDGVRRADDLPGAHTAAGEERGEG